ncbi:MAG: Rab family GTPase [Promethearchaeota archaeon]
MRKSRKIFKLAIGGDGGTGKTTYLHRYCDGIFVADTKLTVGVNFFTKNMDFSGYDVTLSLWDLGGQDQFRILHDQYLLGVVGGMVCFALDRWNSFLNVKNWVELIRGRAPDAPLFLVGMRADLEQESQKIPEDEISNMVAQYNLAGYFRTSSKTGEGVEAPMLALLEEIVAKLC